jgi:hypothetical protein
MLHTVLKDKEKIEETIEELDRYKRDALQKTWEKVDGWVPQLCLCDLTNVQPPFTEISAPYSLNRQLGEAAAS